MASFGEWWARLTRDFKLAMLPHKPGAYRLADKGGVVLYIGATDDLGLRLPQHFLPEEPNPSIRGNAWTFTHQAVDTEEQAKSLQQQWLAQHAQQAGGPPRGNEAASPPGTPSRPGGV
jgi:excinuclease UvrABC nuclease subunit